LRVIQKYSLIRWYFNDGNVPRRRKRSDFPSFNSYLSKNIIYQLVKISNNKLIFSYLRRGGAPSGASSARRCCRLNLSRPQLTGLMGLTATSFATK